MNAQRVVVTGVGAVSALGHDRTAFWNALQAGRSGIGPLEAVDRSQLRFTNAAEVRGWQPETYFDDKLLSLLDRFAQFALVAALEAVADARLVWTPALQAQTGVILGSCIGGLASLERGEIDIYRDNRSRVHPLTVPRVMPNAAASHISMLQGTTGPAYTVSTACASATHAIGQAFWMVRSGIIDLALTGGSEAPLTLGHLKAWEAMRVVANDTCRPFSKNRSGMILGEGGAMLVLEPLEAALKRDAPIYAEIVGFGQSADAGHITSPTVDGPARAMRATLNDANIAPEQINYINAHGTGTQSNDAIETAAIRAVFGDHADRLAVSSTKSMHGHPIGAAGALEAVATVLALHENLLPPTANWEQLDPQCDLDIIPNTARKTEVHYALSNSFAFGGLNAVLAFKHWDGSP